jgi:hypothetical protein
MSRPARASNVSSAKTGELLFLGSERRILTFRISQYEVFYFVQELNNILDEIRVWGPKANEVTAAQNSGRFRVSS